MSQAAEQGTALVIRQHADIGIVVTTDGSICDLPREAYREPEERVIRELQEIGKPFVVLLNSAAPAGEGALRTAEEIRELFHVSCIPVNCQELQEAQLQEILRVVLEAFPLRSLGFFLPSWVMSPGAGETLLEQISEAIRGAGEGIETLGQLPAVLERLASCELFSAAQTCAEDLGQGSAQIRLELPRARYYELLSSVSGMDIPDDTALLAALSELSEAKQDYDHVRQALADVRENGYGVVLPDAAELREWNDALEYFTGARPCANAEEARTALIAGLSAPWQARRKRG